MTQSTGREQAQDQAPKAVPEDTFAVRLMLARVHAGNITVREAARRCGLNYGSWSNWENGMMPRDRVTIAEAVSEGLNIDLNWLIFGGPLAPPESRRPRRAITRGYRHSGPRTRPALLIGGHACQPNGVGEPRRTTLRNPAITH